MSQPLIISAGMPRAGSGWYYNLVHDLVVAGGGQDARQIRSKYYLYPLLTEVNCNISTLNFFRLMPVLLPARLGNIFAVKTHAGPTNFVRWLIEKGLIRVLYIYRDPRAALLSAYEYGQRVEAGQRSNAFSHLHSLEQAAGFINFYVNIWEAWSRIPRVFVLRYEDLLLNYESEFMQTVQFLDLRLTQANRDRVFNQYLPGEADPNKVGTHFHLGEAERFRRVFSPKQLADFTALYEPALQRMGYKS